MKQNELEKKIKELEKRLDKLENKKTEYKFKVGDRVQFKTWDEMAEEYGEIAGTIVFDEDIGVSFNKYMSHLCGTYATIDEIDEIDGDIIILKDFTADGDTIWDYTTHMLKPAVDKSKTWKFTEDEKVILRNLPKEFNYIVRVKFGNLYIHQQKPSKDIIYWESGGEIESLIIYNHLFQSIKWEDEEPCEFRKFI